MATKLKVPGIAAKWLFIISMLILLVSASLAWAVNSLWLYQYGAEKNNVRQTLAYSGLELTDLELERIYAGLISYFNSNEEYISLTVVEAGQPFNLFTPEETIHFKDVKGLIWLDYYLLLGTLVYVLAYAGVCRFWRKRRYWRHLAWGVVGGGGITLALMLVLALGIHFGFRQLFDQFHLLFFRNFYYSAEGFMLLLFPEPFFNYAALFCAGITSGLALILGGIAGSYLLLTRSKTIPDYKKTTLTEL